MNIRPTQPTDKQIEYAEAIANLLGVELPESETKASYQVWISRYSKAYKHAIAQMKLEHEVDMEMIDGRRDW